MRINVKFYCRFYSSSTFTTLLGRKTHEQVAISPRPRLCVGNPGSQEVSELPMEFFYSNNFYSRFVRINIIIAAADFVNYKHNGGRKEVVNLKKAVSALLLF